MSSIDYNKLIDKIKYSKDKVSIITMIESFYDMVYVIESVYLSKSELYKLFDSFDIMNILVFRKWYSDNDSYVKNVFFEYLNDKRKDNLDMIDKYYKYIVIKQGTCIDIKNVIIYVHRERLLEYLNILRELVVGVN